MSRLDPRLLLQGYASGIFPMADSRDAAELFIELRGVETDKSGILGNVLQDGLDDRFCVEGFNGIVDCFAVHVGECHDADFGDNNCGVAHY